MSARWFAGHVRWDRPVPTNRDLDRTNARRRPRRAARQRMGWALLVGVSVALGVMLPW